MTNPNLDNELVAESEQLETATEETSPEAPEDAAPEAEQVADEAPAKPKRVRRAPAVKPAPPAADEAPKAKRGRPRKTEEPAEQIDPGKVRKSSDEIARSTGNFQRYSSPTNRVKSALANLVQDPIRTGSAVKWMLLFVGEAATNFTAKRDRAVEKSIDSKREWMIFLGVDKSDVLHWLVGTKADKLVEMRQRPDGSLVFGQVDMASIRDKYDLDFEWDETSFYYVARLTEGWSQFRFGDLRRAASEAARKTAEGKAEEAEKPAPKATRKTGSTKPSPARIPRQKAKATAGK